MSSNNNKDGSLLDLEIKPIASIEERDEIFKVSNEWGVSPIFPTHVVRKNGKIVGSFSTHSPTVYWWMKPGIQTRESLLVFQACDTLMTQQGYDTYVIPCEKESSYYKLLSNKLSHIQSKDGNDWRLFLNKTY
tara:strand:+ start:546 stop:944 length:399 start_codon:yes stop_codon:yes gene_type:complete